jgi:hypothetical protein
MQDIFFLSEDGDVSYAQSGVSIVSKLAVYVKYFYKIYKCKADSLHTMEALGGRGGIARTHS